jgi:hypothetical protein
MNDEQSEQQPEPQPAPRGKADHLRAHRFGTGTSGNPGGRPRGRGVTAALRALGESEHHGKRLTELLAERLFKEALSGKFTFAKEVLERLEGKVADQHRVEAAGEQRVYICPPPRVIGEGAPALPAQEAGEPGE